MDHYQILIYKYFFHYMLLFNLLIYFEKVYFSILIKSNLFIYFVVSYAFGATSKKLLPSFKS